ncbi:hypothetical protein DFH09DRAFT_1342887 [Mycena vulgaris]|nr:hypothetical protein DFH09DRAFT_1342887 [Mycena vulgaris]
MLANILSMTAPVEGLHWTFPFFAAFLAPFGPDMLFTAAQLVASNTVRRSEQGVAGSLVGTAMNYSVYHAGGTKPLEGIRGAIYLGTGMAILGIVIVLVFVRVTKDRRDGYDEEAEVSQKAQV